MGQTFKKLTKKLALNKDELEILSKFLIDVAKGILGVPLIAYFIQGFSTLVLLGVFMVDFVLVTIFLIFAIKLSRAASKRRI